jgi:hypothetical protein
MATEMDNADVAVWGGVGLEMVRLVSFRDIRHTYASYSTYAVRCTGGKREWFVLCWLPRSQVTQYSSFLASGE